MNKDTKIIMVSLAVVIAFMLSAICVLTTETTAEGQSDVTIKLVGTGYAYTVDEGTEPTYITDASKVLTLDNGAHKINVYNIITAENGDISYSKVRVRTLTVSENSAYTISKISVELGNEGYTSADYTLTATIMDYYGTASKETNTVTYDEQAFSYCVFDDETFDVHIKPKDTKLKAAHILTMTGGENRDFSVTLDDVDVLRITVPADVTVDMKTEGNRANHDYTRDDATVSEKYTSETVKAFEMGSQMKYLTLSGEKYFTNTFIIPAKTDSPRQYIIDETVLKPISGIRDSSYINRDPAAYWNNNNANILANINFENFVSMDVEETKDVTASRAIFTIQPETNPVQLIGINIYVAEPPFKYTVMNLDGTPSDIVTIDGTEMRAVKEGTAIVAITYDAFGCYSFNEGYIMLSRSYYKCSYALNTGLWYENTDVFVVNVGGDDSTIKTNMTVNEWLNPDLNEDGTYKYLDTFMDEKASAGKTSGNFLDSELDPLYYLEGEDGYHYTFTPESGCSVTVYNPIFKDGKLTGFKAGTVTEKDGTFTAVLTEGRNIIKVQKGDDVTYQVATAKETTYEVEYTYNTKDGKLYPGDQIKITFGDLFSPLSRTTLYNTNTYLAYYESDGKDILNKFTNAPNGTQIGSYDFGYDASKHTITITIPNNMEPGEHTLNGTFHIKGFGNPLGNHHSIGNNIKDNSAPGIDAFLGVLPGVTFTVADYGTITYDTGVTAKTGTEFTSSQEVTTQTYGKVIDTLVVEKGQTITYIVNGVNPVHTSIIMQSCPDGWNWSIPDGVYSSKEITYTFTATESIAPKISLGWAAYTFTVEVVVVSDGKYSYTENVAGSTEVKDSSVVGGFSTPSGKAITLWNTKSDMSGTYYKAGDTYTLANSTEDVTLYAAPSVTYNVEDGTISLKNGENEVESGQCFEAGTELTLTYVYDAANPVVLLMNEEPIPINTKNTTYTFTVNGNVEITSSDAVYVVSWTEEEVEYSEYYLSLSQAIESAGSNGIVLINDDELKEKSTISTSLTMSPGKKLIVGSSATLTIAKDATLTISEDAVLQLIGGVTNNGTVVNNGLINQQKNKISGTITGDGVIKVVPFFDVGDTLTFVSGTGTVKHTSGWDQASFNKNATTKMTFTVTTASTGINDWGAYGTVTLTDLNFSSDADLVYIPSFFIGKLTIDGVNYLTYCKVTAISDEAMEKINERTINVVLPQALKDTKFSDSVTILTGSHYTDTLGNVYYYDVVETSPVWYNGYTTYGGYGYVEENADPRYCEQGNVTKIVFKDGITATTTGLSTWSKNPLASSDEWIGSASAWGDIIGLVILNDFDLSDETKYEYSCDVEINGTVTIVQGITLAIPKDLTFTISDGAELNLIGTGKVTNKGTIVNDGTIKLQKNKISGTITGNGEIKVVPFFNVGDTLTFVSGTGTVQHTSGWDKASFNKDATTKMTFTVTTASTGVNNWDIYGTVTLTDLNFSSDADLVYIPSFFIGKLTIDGVNYLTYCKVTAISDEAMAKINERTINVVLPQALKDTKFSDSVTILTGSHYTDTLGNVYYYDVVETSPVWYNGYTTYGGYGYVEENADPRYCEQGNVTKIVFKDGITATTTGLSTWSKNPLASSDEWIGSASAWGDIIGLVILNDFDLSDETKYEYSCDVEINGTIVIDKDLIVDEIVSIEDACLAADSKIIVRYAEDGSGKFTGTVYTSLYAYKFTGVSPTDTSDYEISVTGTKVNYGANGSSSPIIVRYGVNSIDVAAFSSDSIIVDIHPYDDSVTPAGKLIITYSAYIEGAEGVMLNPFLVMTQDVDADVSSLEIATEHTVVSCSISYYYQVGDKAYYTPVKDAKAPTVAVLDLESDLTVNFNGNAVVDGSLLSFGEYAITVATEETYKVNDVEWKDGDYLFYYGQKIVISKV